MPPNTNSNTKPKPNPNPNPNRRAIFLGGNCPDTVYKFVPKLYSHSPYLTLDKFYEDQNNDVFNDAAGESIGDSVSSKDFVSTNFSESTDEYIVYKGLSQKKYCKRKRVFGESCRSILNETRSLTLLLEDNEDLMSETYQSLKPLKDRMEKKPSRRKRSPVTKQKKIENKANKGVPTPKEF